MGPVSKCLVEVCCLHYPQTEWGAEGLRFAAGAGGMVPKSVRPPCGDGCGIHGHWGLAYLSGLGRAFVCEQEISLQMP